MRTNNVALGASPHLTQLWFMVISSVWSVGLTSSSAVQATPVRQITTWLLVISGVRDEERGADRNGYPLLMLR